MGRETTDAEVQQVYDEYWKRIVEPDGELDIEQVKKELFDFHWETEEGWEEKVAEPVVFFNMSPREAKQILELVGECLSRPGYSVELILKAIKSTPHLQDLIRVAELAEVAGDVDIDCPFCGVVGDREHRPDCLVIQARKVLVKVKAAME